MVGFNKEQIRAANDRPREFVPVACWTPEGETFDPAVHGVWVGTMSAKDRDEWEQYIFSRKVDDESSNRVRLRAATAICSVQDADGKRIFTEADADWLSDKAAGPLSEIFDVATRLSRLRKGDQEELTKN